MSILGRLFSGSKKAAATLPREEDATSPDPPRTMPGGVLSARLREDADAFILRGQELEDAGDAVAAEVDYRKALSLAPFYARAHINLGNALQKLGRLQDSAASFRDALEHDPDYVGAHFNLGVLLIELGDTPKAKSHLERALELNPAMLDAAVVLATAYEADGDLHGARRQLERALSIEPHHNGAAANLGILLLDTGDLDAADQLLRKVLLVEPPSLQALLVLARFEILSGHADRAEASYRKVLQLDPQNMGVWSSFLFSLNLREVLDAASVAREHLTFGKKFGSGHLSTPSGKPGSRRIRVGYVSGDLMKHPVALFLRPILALHDRMGFESFCYYNGRVRDELTMDLQEAADHWRSIAGSDDAAVADQIRADGIDLLVDLSGHTDLNRLGVFARKPAPVQATWLGYLNTTGLREMDFRICDNYTDPEGQTESLNSETLARLPNSQWCYLPYYDVPLRNLPDAAGRPVTFGSFNQFVKLSDSCLDVWATILRELPDARLSVHGVPRGAVANDFHERLERRGVTRDRVELHGRIGILEYFAAIQNVDIALDSMPYNGATTTLDTLWMGVPVVALRGDRTIGRGAYSIVSAAGLSELVAEELAEYIEKNIRLARDSDARIALRKSLRVRLQGSPLMDTKTFINDVEDLYRSMFDGR